MKWFKKKLDTTSFTHLIAAGMVVNGTITFSGTVKIQGEVMGDVIINNQANTSEADAIIVDDTGSVHSEKMQATNIVIAGSAQSKTIWAEDTLRILKSAKISGADIYFRTLEIEPGADIHDCHLHNLSKSSAAETI